jgi:hypothetical protein
MVDSTISRLRMRDLARLGRSRAGHRPASGPPPVACASQSGQLTPRSNDLTESPIPSGAL